MKGYARIVRIAGRRALVTDVNARPKFGPRTVRKVRQRRNPIPA
jgi:hypothetical protein